LGALKEGEHIGKNKQIAVQGKIEKGIANGLNQFENKHDE